MQEEQTIVPILMNMDAAPEQVSSQECRYALNNRPTSFNDEADGARTNILGTTLVNADLPGGKNVVVGSKSDDANNTCIYFLWNEYGQHGIYRYFPGTNSVQRIYQSTYLDFSETTYLNGIDLVGDLLYFNNPDTHQYKINIAKANMNGKQQVAHIYFADSTETFSINPTFRRKSDNFIISLGELNLLPESGVSAAEGAYQTLIDPTNNPIPNYFDFQLQGNYIVVTAKRDEWFFDLFSSSNSNAWMIGQNFYDGDSPMYSDLGKYQFITEPKVTLKNDSSLLTNFIRGHLFQFRARAIYDDYEPAKLGAWSSIAVDKQSTGRDILDTSKNYIEIDYSDEGRLFQPDYRNLIKYIEITARDGNTGAEKLIAQLDQSQLTGTYKFYNDGQFDAIDPALSTALFDNIPINSKTASVFNRRLFLGNNTVGFPQVPTDMKFDLSVQPGAENYLTDIKGRILILNSQDGSFGTVHIDSGNNANSYYGADNYSQNLALRAQQYLPAHGFTVYLAGTPYYAVTTQTTAKVSLPSGFGANKTAFVQEFTIKDVPAGKYILRVASHYCDFTGSMGDSYRLTNSDLTYQKSSTFLMMMAGNWSKDTGVHEFEIDITPPTSAGNVFNLQGQSLPFDGYVVIADNVYQESAVGQAILFGYLVEEPTQKNTADLMAGAFRMEGQNVGFHFGSTRAISAQSKFTDHNGFYWAAGSYSNTGGAGNCPVSTQAVAINSLVLKTLQNSWFAGSVFSDSTSLSPILPSTAGAEATTTLINEARETIAFSSNKATKIRTNIHGLLIDANGDTAANIKVALTKNGRQTTTSQDGQYSIVVYDLAFDNSTPGRQNDKLIFNYNETLSLKIPAFTAWNPNGLSKAFNANTDFYVDPSSGGYLFPLSAFKVALTNQLSTALKKGGNYQLGIIYRDNLGRLTSVMSDSRYVVNVPSLTSTANAGQPTLGYQINHAPPDFATAYSFVLTPNQNQRNPLQIVAADAKYVTSWDTTGAVSPISSSNIVTFGNSGATSIFIDVSTLLYYKQAYPDSQLGYSFSAGDRLTLLRDATGNIYSTRYDIEIRGTYGSYIIIPYNSSWPQIQAGSQIEIYSPSNNTTTKVFYEFGGWRDVKTFLGSKIHAGDTEDQDQSPDYETPATGTFSEGDTYYRRRTMFTNAPVAASTPTVFSYYVEDPNPSDFFAVKGYSQGRPNQIDLNKRSLQRNVNVAWSSQFIPDTLENGLSSFEALNNEDTDPLYGGLTKLQPSNNILLAIHQKEVVSLYIDQQVIMDANGQQQVLISDKVIGTKRVLVGGYGTNHPESVDTINGETYWWSDVNARPVRYAADGIDPIDINMRSYFTNKQSAVKALGLCDNKTGEYLLCFQTGVEPDEVETISDLNGGFTEIVLSYKPAYETIAFNFKNKGWTNFYSYGGESLSRAGIQSISFNKGQLWTHESNSVRNSFYGALKPSKLSIVANSKPQTLKNWISLGIKATNKWEAPSVTNDKNQDTDLLVVDFMDVNGQWIADFRRDKNTPYVTDPLINGDPIVSEWIEIDLTNTDTVLNSLKWIYVRSNVNNFTMVR